MDHWRELSGSQASPKSALSSTSKDRDTKPLQNRSSGVSKNGREEDIGRELESSNSKELLRTKENEFKRKHYGVVGILSWQCGAYGISARVKLNWIRASPVH